MPECTRNVHIRIARATMPSKSQRDFAARERDESSINYGFSQDGRDSDVCDVVIAGLKFNY